MSRKKCTAGRQRIFFCNKNVEARKCFLNREPQKSLVVVPFVALVSKLSVRFIQLRSSFALVVLLLAGCGTKQVAKIKTAPNPLPARVGMKEQGIASWYGPGYHGRRAANGEVYNMDDFTAAHQTLPFDTWVTVRNLANQKVTTVRITDRGPFVEGRIIDLSRSAAMKIDLIRPGTAHVQLTVVHPPKDASKFWYSVQAGAADDKKVAQRILNGVAQYPSPRISENHEASAARFRVLVGREKSVAAARALLKQVHRQFQDAFLVRTL